MGLMANRCGRAVQLTLRCWRSHSIISYSTVSHHGTDNSSWRSGYAIAAVGSILGAATCCFSEAHAEPPPTKITEKTALNPKEWVQFKLEETARVSHNTNIYRFSFDPDAKLGLRVASCFITRAPLGTDNEGKPKYVIRPYTPISDPESKGYFDLLIKTYPEGKMSQHFAHLKPGDTLDVKGPIEKLPYHPNMKKHIGMVAGGTGITPMLQIIDAILKNPEDITKVSLLYANVSPDDILLKEKLDALSSSHPNFKVYYVVDKPSSGWRGGVGYISKEMVLKGLPFPSEETLILVASANIYGPWEPRPSPIG